MAYAQRLLMDQEPTSGLIRLGVRTAAGMAEAPAVLKSDVEEHELALRGPRNPLLRR